MAPKMAKRFQALRQEKFRRKKLVADPALDNAILQQAAQENLDCRPPIPASPYGGVTLPNSLLHVAAIGRTRDVSGHHIDFKC